MARGPADDVEMAGRIEMFVHVVWATWRRLPLVDDSVAERLHEMIRKKCVELGCPPVAVGGIADHVHLLVRLHPSVAVARLVGEAKGISSFLMNHELRPGGSFRWQERYDAITVAPDDLPAVERYVNRQPLHHGTRQLLCDFEPAEPP